MNLDDLIQYVSQEAVLIGMQLEARAFLIVQLRYIEHSDNIIKIFHDNNLLSVNKLLMISKGANNWNHGLQGACYGGHQDLVALMISKGSFNWNFGLAGACRGGQKDLAEWMISKGAYDWNWGLKEATYGGHKNLAIWLLEKKQISDFFGPKKPILDFLAPKKDLMDFFRAFLEGDKDLDE